jgi:hypothetical protein
MTLAFRNVEVAPETPVEEWPAEAVATALERGSLVHWRLIAEAIRDSPWGPLARTVEAIVGDDGGPYGVGAGMRRVIAQARQRWERHEREAVAAEFNELRATAGLSAGEFARLLGTSPSRMSTYLSGKVTPSAALMVRARRVASGAGGLHHDVPAGGTDRPQPCPATRQSLNEFPDRNPRAPSPGGDA